MIMSRRLVERMIGDLRHEALLLLGEIHPIDVIGEELTHIAARLRQLGRHIGERKRLPVTREQLCAR
jgi:hypothetical protein